MSTDNPYDVPESITGRPVGMHRHTTTISRIGVLSLAKLQAVVMFGVGLVFSACIMLGMVLGISAGAGNDVGAAKLLGGGIGMILAFLVAYPLFGFIGGAFGAVLYNLAAGAAGGLEIELRHTD